MGLQTLIRSLVPAALRRRAARAMLPEPVGGIDFGDLRRTSPISREWGFERGTPIDRHYIAEFLEGYRDDVAGVVLEVEAPMYTERYGGRRVRRSEVLHVEELRPGITMIGDLARPDDFEAEQFDCVILTQTLQMIYDVRAAVETVHKVLKPGGVVLATFPGISKISRADADRWGYNWSLTAMSARRLFADAFGAENTHVEAVGNVLAASAFLYGLAAEELTRAELDAHDPDFEVLIRVRATREPTGP